jgi:hypothetical protein
MSLAPPRIEGARTEGWVRALLGQALESAPSAGRFADRLLTLCGIRLHDILDHIALPHDPEMGARGWRIDEDSVWRAPHGLLPPIVESSRFAIALRVECVEKFLAATGIEARIEGEAHGPYRSARVFEGRGVSFVVVERRGFSEFSPPPVGSRKIRRARIHQQVFRTRRRQFQNAARGLAHIYRLAEAAAADLGPSWAGALFLRAEREYWLTRCASALRQHQRQVEAGVGWCAVEHHAYACSREHFNDTIQVLCTLGHRRGEIVRAGNGAQWGVQVLDASATAIAPYTMVSLDLAPGEGPEGIGRGMLSPLTWHGPPGLWSALHGESILDAGLHCVSAVCDEGARSGLATSSLERGALPTEASVAENEPRPVDPRRVELLERDGYISREQAEFYRLCGAAGAHFQPTSRTTELTTGAPRFAADPLPDADPGGPRKRKRRRVKRARLLREGP